MGAQNCSIPDFQHKHLNLEREKPATAACSAGQAAPADKKAPKENGAASAAVQQAPAGRQETPTGGDAKEAKGGKQQKKGKQGKCLGATAGCCSCTQGAHGSDGASRGKAWSVSGQGKDGRRAQPRTAGQLCTTVPRLMRAGILQTRIQSACVGGGACRQALVAGS